MSEPTTHNDESIARLDTLLRDWHDANRARTSFQRETVLVRARQAERAAGSAELTAPLAPPAGLRFQIGRAMSWRLAAAIAILAGVAVVLLPQHAREARADVLMLPEGGRLEAFDQQGNAIGPCALTHTDVEIEVSGLFARTTVRQQYHNPYDAKIEAVYTFPLPHDGAVDRMRMVIDEDRIVEGEVREREEARQIYESARDAGHVAALLEQERPNIFTQSVANIEQDAEIAIEISYIEMVAQRDGEFTLAFPMTVAPRYIPGYALPDDRGRDARANDGRATDRLPDGLTFRRGVILQSPATFERITLNLLMPKNEFGVQGQQVGSLTTSLGPCPQLQALLDRAIPITDAGIGEWRSMPEQQERFLRLPDFAFHAIYGDGSREIGQLSGEGLGHISGRWFWFDPAILNEVGLLDSLEGHPPLAPPSREGDLGAKPFAVDTDQVPDASRITPMPVHPSMRAGHDISVRVSIDSGGPGIASIVSELHEVVIDDQEPESRAVIELKNGEEIPNRDFVLKWRFDDSAIRESTFVHAGDDFEQNGGYFTLLLAPPARVEAGDIRPREIIFVLDTSGSMSGEPIAKAKSVLTSTIDAMRDGDTFNVITFAGTTDILWATPRPNTNGNRAEALAWINSREGAGGTEMMAAIEAALNPQNAAGQASPQPSLSLEELSNLPADGREVRVQFRRDVIRPGEWWSKTAWGSLTMREDLAIDWTAPSWEIVPLMDDAAIELLVGRGTWITRDGRRYFDMHDVEAVSEPAAGRADAAPLRLCVFLTDGEVGNDMAIIDAVKEYAATTRVFAFGVGNSVNRYLLANMAHAGRGEVEFVTQETERKDAVERFVKRIESPVLTDIELDFSEGLEVSDILPLTPGGYIPDLYDVQPLVIHGRYATPGKGTLTVRGRAGAEVYERLVNIEFPARSEGHDVIRTLWARKKVDELTNADLTGVQLGQMPADERQAIVDLAVKHQIMSQFTSFVAVEKSRVTVDGRPMLVRVPIELPSDGRWEGFFGGDGCVDTARVEKAIDDMLAAGKAVAMKRAKEFEQLRVESAKLDETGRQARISELLLQVRDEQLSRNYSGALETIDHVLFLDPENPVALALRDAVETAALWKSYVVTEREKEQSYSWQMQDNREAGIAARANFGPGARSTTGLMQYPDDWPSLQLSQARAVEPLYHLGDYFTDSGRLTDPLVFDSYGRAEEFKNQIAFGQQFGIPADAAAGEVTYITGTVGSPIRGLQSSPINVQQDSIDLVDLLGGFGSDSFAGTILSNNPALMSHEADQRVAMALQEALPTVEFQDNKLEQVLEFLTTVSGVNIQADWSALANIGVQPEVRIALAMEQVSIEGVLDSVLAQVGSGDEAAAGWRIKDGLVVIGPESTLDKVECVYDLRELIDASARNDAAETTEEANLEELREAKAQELVRLVQEYIDPDGWQDGDIEMASGILTVRTSIRNHGDVAGLLSQLWEIRGPVDSSIAEPVAQTETPRQDRLAQAIIELREFAASSDSRDAESASPRAAAALALVFDPSDPAHHPFYIERCAIAVDELIAAGHVDEARTLAAWIVAALDPKADGAGDSFRRDLVAALRGIVESSDSVSKNLDPESAEAAHGASVRSAAEESMKSQLQAAIVEETLRTRLDEELFTRWLQWSRRTAEHETAADATEASAKSPLEPILVTALLSESPSDAHIEQLRQAGFAFESKASRSSIVVGRLGVANLERIALLPCIRRMERTQ
jgi:hypothetical protein